MFRADLHCHSTCSDGTFSPQELIALALKSDLQGLSITDHDSIDAYPQVLQDCQKAGLLMVPGVEFSAYLEKHNVHLLAYSFRVDAPELYTLCQKHLHRRTMRNQAILERLTKLGMPLYESDLVELGAPTPVIGRPHIAVAMQKKGYVATFQEAFHKYIGEGRPCFVSGEQISIEETLETIKKAGGLAVIAHPHLIKDHNVLQKLLTYPFDGIECYYGNHPTNIHQRWVKMAQQKGWLLTGGSDFHGSIKPGIPLGCSWTPEESFQVLLKHYQSNR